MFPNAPLPIHTKIENGGGAGHVCNPLEFIEIHWNPLKFIEINLHLLDFLENSMVLLDIDWILLDFFQFFGIIAGFLTFSYENIENQCKINGFEAQG